MSHRIRGNHIVRQESQRFLQWDQILYLGTPSALNAEVRVSL